MLITSHGKAKVLDFGLRIGQVRRAAGSAEFVRELGREIVRRGHVLVNGTSAETNGQRRDPKDFIVAYCDKNHAPAHNIGNIRRSSLPDWNMNHPELKVPEQIALADATIFVAGRDGTFWARDWAYYPRKPILGVPRND